MTPVPMLYLRLQPRYSPGYLPGSQGQQLEGEVQHHDWVGGIEGLSTTQVTGCPLHPSSKATGFPQRHLTSLPFLQ
jgi:hypothetical protein